MEKNTKKIGLFTLSMIVMGSMIGSGIVVVPNRMMSFGLAGTVGWILASLCSLILARIFIDITLASPDSASLSNMIAKEYGPQLGFVAGISHVVFMVIGCSIILNGFIDYLFDFIGIAGDLQRFVAGALVIWGLNIMHGFTNMGFQLLSTITILKIVLFTLCAILGISEFNAAYVFCLEPGASLLSKISITSIANGFVGALQASSVALFAFAGLESASASPDVVKNPQTTIPKATIIGVGLCSFIYLFTHICVVNALGGGIKSTIPVKTALEMLISRRFGEYAGVLLGVLVSVIVALGCLGTLLALMYVAPNVLYDSFKIADDHFKSPRSRTGLPVKMSVMISAGITALSFYKNVLGMDVSAVNATANFLLVYFYFTCVLCHFRTGTSKGLSILGFAACLILLFGCNPASVFLGVILQLVTQILFAVLSSKSKSLPELKSKH